MSNIIIFASFGKQLIRKQLTNGLKPLIVNQLLENTKKSSIIAFKRFINTSDKKKGNEFVGSYVPGFMDEQPKGPKTVREFADVESQKNWITYGWDIGNMAEDRAMNWLAFFLVVTITTVAVPYVAMYYPDYKLLDWSVREAYLQIDRRERLGLPLIDRNVVDPNLLVLPSDEELGDTEIYI